MVKSIKTCVVLSAVALAVWLALFPPSFLTPQAGRAAAFTLVILSFWATGFVAEYLTALIFFTGAMLLNIASPDIIFSGFSSGAFWLIFGGLVLGVAINVTGLGKRIAAAVANRLNRNYAQLIGGLVFPSALSGLLMPSALGRVVLLVPFAVTIAEQFGLQKGRKGYTGIVAAVVLGSFLPGFAILPANVPNMVLSGLSETLYHYSPLYGEYLLLHFPVLGVVKCLLLWLIILILFPDTVTNGPHPTQQEAGVMTADEKVLSFVLVVMLVLWISDFLHHIAPAWVAMTGACIVLLPFVNIVSSQSFQQKVNLGSLFYIAGILGLGQMINQTGLGSTLAKQCIAILPMQAEYSFVNFMSLSLLALFTGIFTTQPGIPAVLTPFAGELAEATGFSIKAVVMSQVAGFSQPLFPYQVPPLLLGMQMAGVHLFEGFKICFFLVLAAIFLLFPLDFL
ncbi:MAG: SLC13 family permease, partial [Desulforhopalus sp.]